MARDGPSFTNFYIKFLVDATVNFLWSYETADEGGPSYDPFGYVLASDEAELDAGFAQLTDDFGAVTQSGSASVFVQAGQYFGFSAYTSTTLAGRPRRRCRNPSSLLLLALALAAAGAATRRRRTA